MLCWFEDVWSTLTAEHVPGEPCQYIVHVHFLHLGPVLLFFLYYGCLQPRELWFTDFNHVHVHVHVSNH